MFWIYRNKAKATLHRDSCVDCNFGMGKKESVDLSGKWDGPFELLEDVATEHAKSVTECRKCKPRKDW